MFQTIEWQCTESSKIELHISSKELLAKLIMVETRHNKTPRLSHIVLSEDDDFLRSIRMYLPDTQRPTLIWYLGDDDRFSPFVKLRREWQRKVLAFTIATRLYAVHNASSAAQEAALL